MILSDRVDRVDELARRCKELELDGILVDTISLDSAGPTVALPRSEWPTKGIEFRKWRFCPD